jgi:hypothetical protein
MMMVRLINGIVVLTKCGRYDNLNGEMISLRGFLVNSVTLGSLAYFAREISVSARTARKERHNTGLPGCFSFDPSSEAQDFRGGQDVAG